MITKKKISKKKVEEMVSALDALLFAQRAHIHGSMMVVRSMLKTAVGQSERVLTPGQRFRELVLKLPADDPIRRALKSLPKDQDL